MNTTSRIYQQPPSNPTLITPDYSPTQISTLLRRAGCSGCDLGFKQGYLPVIYRGNDKSGRMIVGEAPGREEDKLNKPFVGPAGELLDKILLSVGWTESDWYFTNVIKCRPAAPEGSGKQNTTPLVSHQRACKPILQQEIRWVKPYLVLLLGKSAVTGMFPARGQASMEELAGQSFLDSLYPGIVFFVMYHPAYMLHSQADEEKYNTIRSKMWTHIQLLKELDQEITDET